jgi:uncharacterized membrane protein YphA (DoxX/SURF4 family)
MTLTPARGLAVLRAAFGLYLVVSALSKTTSGWFSSTEPLMGFVGRNLEGATPIYASFLDGTVLPYAAVFAPLVVLGEFVAGVSLLLGLGTRLGGIVGAWLVLNYMLTKGLLNDAGSSDRLFFVACLTFAVAAAGLVWGLDGALRPILETNPITRWLAGLPTPSPVRRLDLPERAPRREERRAA